MGRSVSSLSVTAPNNFRRNLVHIASPPVKFAPVSVAQHSTRYSDAKIVQDITDNASLARQYVCLFDSSSNDPDQRAN